jgi:hypothetical protein
MEGAAIEAIAVAAGVLLLIGFVCGYGVRVASPPCEGRTTALRTYGGGSHAEAEAGATRNYLPKG